MFVRTQRNRVIERCHHREVDWDGIVASDGASERAVGMCLECDVPVASSLSQRYELEADAVDELEGDVDIETPLELTPS